MTINPSVKFEVKKLNGMSNFRLWKMRVKDMLAQQTLHKKLHETKPTDVHDID